MPFGIMVTTHTVPRNTSNQLTPPLPAHNTRAFNMNSIIQPSVCCPCARDKIVASNLFFRSRFVRTGFVLACLCVCVCVICYFHCALRAFYFLFLPPCYISSFVPAEFVFEKWHVLCLVVTPSCLIRHNGHMKLCLSPANGLITTIAVLWLRNRWHSGVSASGVLYTQSHAAAAAIQFTTVKFWFDDSFFAFHLFSIFPFGDGLRNVYDDFWPNACG